MSWQPQYLHLFLCILAFEPSKGQSKSLIKNTKPIKTKKNLGRIIKTCIFFQLTKENLFAWPSAKFVTMLYVNSTILTKKSQGVCISTKYNFIYPVLNWRIGSTTFGFQRLNYIVGEADGSLRVCLDVRNFKGIPFAGK